MRIRSLFSVALSTALLLSGALPASINAADAARADAAIGEADASETGAEAHQPTLVIAPADPVLSGMKSTLELSAIMRNPTDAVLAAGDLVFELSDEPVQNTADLAGPEGLAFTMFTELEVGETPPSVDDESGENRSKISIAPEDLPFTDTTAPGTYLVRATFTAEGTDASLVTATTPVVWRGAGAGTDTGTDTSTGTEKIAVSMIVPFLLPTTISTVPTRAQLSEHVPRWDALLTAAESARATLALDPRIIAGIRSYGVEAPDAAREFLTRLEATTSTTFLLQFADADPAAQAALGFTSLLEPTSLEFVTRFGKFEAASDESSAEETPADDIPGDEASGSPDAGTDAAANETPEDVVPSDVQPRDETPGKADSPGGTADASFDPPPVEPDADPIETGPPTLTELIAWNGEPAAWPAEGNVDQGTLDLLTASNIESLVLDSSNVTHTGGPRISLADGSALVTDSSLGAASTSALTGSTEVDRAAGLAALTGSLAVRAQMGEEGVAIGLSRAAMADAEDPESLIDALASLDFVRATRVADQSEGTGSLRAAGPLEPRLALLRSAADREASVNEVGAVLVQPQYLSGYQRTRLLDLFATRYAPADGGFDDAEVSYRARDSELLEGVQVISTEHTQLVGVSTSVPVQLHNMLPFNARITVVAVPVSAAIDVEQRVFTDVDIAADANERVLVPVRSRVSSGESGLVVTVSAPGGEPTVFTGTLPLSISSSVETVALWLLGVSAALLIVLGVIRSVRKRRISSKEPNFVEALEAAE